MLQLYYGNGKGKTSAAVGAAIRASGAGMRVLFLSFYKDGSSSECSVLKKLHNVAFAVADEPYILFEQLDESKKERLRASYSALLQRAETDPWDMLILDEGLDAVSKDFIDESRILSFIEKGEVIVTGHTLFPLLTKKADYITEFISVRHPFDQGTPARKGIEY